MTFNEDYNDWVDDNIADLEQMYIEQHLDSFNMYCADQYRDSYESYCDATHDKIREEQAVERYEHENTK